ncbi:hypothetical protein HPB52_021030 [Rhipicephalus sanguineus]|uniref:Uncharacterized protein n=1 Tax=Rhipicephalus sanguineus TaxID=34632 RepID=A0A9D4QAX8_RHISA|nr:hypothetical protein HPB52_021030 [Rhipicephalus sanguineus]
MAVIFVVVFGQLHATAPRCHEPRKDSGGVGVTTSARDRTLSGNWISTADNTASSAVRMAHESVKGLQRWSSFRHPPATCHDITVPPPSRDQQSEVNMILRMSSFIALFILAAVIVAILLLPQSHHTSGDEKSICSTSDCAYHVHVLGLNRSRTAKPCDDFGRFVCSGWVSKYRDISFTVQMDAVMDWITRLSQSSRRANWTAGVTGRPLNMMRVCVEGASSEDDALRELVSFVSGRSFSWPTSDWKETAVVQPRLPLRALLELAVRWGLPLWFRVDLVPSHREDRISVVISPSPFPTAFHYLHSRFLRYADVYPYYVQEFIDTVFSHRPAAPAFETFIRDSVYMQGHVFGNMTAAAAAPYFAPRVVAVERLQSLVKNVSAEDWIIALRFVGTTSLNNDSLVLAANKNTVTAMDTLFGVYTARDIWFHTAWWFVQAVGLVAVNSLSSELKVHPLGKALKSIICAIHVDASYSALLATNYKSHLTTTEQHIVKRLFDNIRAVAVEKVRSFTTLTSSSRSALATLLENTDSAIWPQHGFDSSAALEILYGSGYTQTGNFFAEWLWTRLQIQRASLTAVHTEASTVFGLLLRRLGWYNAALSVISISPAALAPPFYYTGGTSAMVYGGLGYIIAAETICALNSLYYIFNDDETLTPRDVAGHRTIWSKFSCDSDKYHLLFPDHPAVDVAYSAYVRFKNQSFDLPLQGLKKYSPEQLFFINYCHTGCYINNKGAHVNPACTAVLSIFAPFAVAFSCPPGSVMNSAHKCGYF